MEHKAYIIQFREYGTYVSYSQADYPLGGDLKTAVVFFNREKAYAYEILDSKLWKVIEITVIIPEEIK